ncbi:spore cortex biosynthesis protein YabQ [Schnuerera sp. xch1]|uniref:spore cortex biosynthesis protein YabQ n=1 Tax=Schnuerera sp. xch1 TaxID=2874283 RepID=UPI001CBADD12|nr:spore cortex biosynthesis protein YabQ [Schnuerera sp. xch1]MBZ2174586.1 spore cortex biosynthesis protein YabQ [Schnuerera sp. xch1]
MDTTIKIQFYIFLTAVYGGLITGLAYDIYRATRYCFKPKKIVTIIEDLLFWIGIALIFFYIINKSSWDQLRGYIFIGFFVGGYIYIKTLSKIIFSLTLKLFDGIGYLLRSIVNILILPFRFTKKIISPKLKKINKARRVPVEAIKEIKRYKKIISKKK